MLHCISTSAFLPSYCQVICGTYWYRIICGILVLCIWHLPVLGRILLDWDYLLSVSTLAPSWLLWLNHCFIFNSHFTLYSSSLECGFLDLWSVEIFIFVVMPLGYNKLWYTRYQLWNWSGCDSEALFALLMSGALKLI